MTSSPDAGSRGFVAVNHTSSSVTGTSSRLSSQQDHSPRELQINGGTSSQSHGQEHPSSARPIRSHLSVDGVRPSASESQMVDVLQREVNVPESQPRIWDHQPTATGQEIHDQYNHETATGFTTVAPKRKRNFSNRTKTGCLTCRARKKKCDERQPACNNCFRRGFTCKGYSVSTRVIPTKPELVKVPVPLQTKDGQCDVSEPSTYQGLQLEIPRSSRPHVHHDGGQALPIPIDDNNGLRQPPYGSSLPRSEPLNRPPFPGQQRWPSQQSQHSFSEHPPPQGNSYPQHPPSSYQAQPPGQMQYPPQRAAPQPPSTNVGHSPSAPLPQQPAQWQQPQQPPYLPAYPAPSSSHPTPAGNVRMSSSGFSHPRSSFKVSSGEDVEKSKMLRSMQYHHFDPTLLYERQRCDRALERYNAACKLDSGLTEQEVRNLLIKVTDPSQDTTHKFPSQNHGKGHVGLGVKIEAPFTCTYGYNLRIQDGVYVGKGCTFDDAGIIEIGPRTIIGPGVTILTTDYCTDPVYRKGAKGYWIAKDVYIASGVVVGAKAVIYPGVKIEEVATVDPCAVVRESLKANQIHRASPAQIIDAIQR